jgi:hypothetical protein
MLVELRRVYHAVTYGRDLSPTLDLLPDNSGYTRIHRGHLTPGQGVQPGRESNPPNTTDAERIELSQQVLETRSPALEHARLHQSSPNLSHPNCNAVRLEPMSLDLRTCPAN